MTEPIKKRRAKPATQRTRVDKGKTVLGQTIVDAESTTGNRSRPDDVKAAAKALYSPARDPARPWGAFVRLIRRKGAQLPRSFRPRIRPRRRRLGRRGKAH
jgi:hypothetical protein